MKTYVAFLAILVLIIAGIAIYGPSSPTSDETVESGISPTPPSVPPRADEGRVVFALGDTAVDVKNIDSVLFTINEVRVHSEKRGWITVSEEVKQFDLLRLKETGAFALITEANLEAGSYDQIRLAVKSVKVITGEISEDAKLPSQDLKMQGTLIVEAGSTSSVMLDVVADQSLHKTGSGRFIFAPVIKMETRHDATVKISNNNVEAEGGTVVAETSFGMNENGEMRAGFVLDAKGTLQIEIVGEAIRLLAPNEKEADITVTAQAAIESAGQVGAIDSALSVKLVTREGKKVWRITGFKGAEIVTIFVDTSTGGIIAVE